MTDQPPLDRSVGPPEGEHGSNFDGGVHAEVFGTGPRAVFVHGWFSWGTDTFPRQVDLADDYQVVLIDRRGYGRSKNAGLPDWRLDAQAVLKLLGSGGHLVGHSLGAVVALVAAGLRPDLVRSLVIIEPPAASLARGDPAADRFEAALRPVFEAAAGMTAREFRESWSRALRREPDTSGYSEADWEAVEATRHERWPTDAPIDLATVASGGFPILVVEGAWPGVDESIMRDGFSAVDRALTEGLGAPKVVFERSAHNPQLEEPEKFNKLLRDFWASVEADDR
jgi:pimeloyl-ACP methyl ester carboxylesterase